MRSVTTTAEDLDVFVEAVETFDEVDVLSTELVDENPVLRLEELRRMGQQAHMSRQQAQKVHRQK